MMPFYVRVSGRGKATYVEFAKWCVDRDILDAEFFTGGWNDYHLDAVLPHVRFNSSEDAVAYALSTGGEASTSIPLRPRPVEDSLKIRHT